MTGAVAMQTERCGRCGKMSPVTAAFCPRCGVRLRDVSPVLQAEVLDAEPVAPSPNWEVLDPPPVPTFARPAPVIPRAPIPRASYTRATPTWTGPRPTMSSGWSPSPTRVTPQPKKKSRWLWIGLAVFAFRATAAWNTHSSSTRSPNYPSYNSPTPPARSTPVYSPYHPPSSPRHR
jgi:hypothetical protein